MKYQDALNYLYNLKGSEHRGKFNLTLTGMRALVKKLGNPQEALKIIHVAGTNGKGSVCAMVSAILQERGYRVGLYTSPHLKDFRERLQINNQKISEEDLVKYVKKIKPLIKSQTFFEVLTSVAFLYFKEKNVDFLVCEVGMGGRLDATNVVNPILSIITNISLEHQDYLGTTIKKISLEKAGIIKEGLPIVTGAKGVSLSVIKEVARQKHAKVYLDGKPLRGYTLGLKGSFQLANASIALTAVNVLNKGGNLKITSQQIKRGLLKTKWHGRFEFISRKILVDCAHNPEAIRALKKEILKIRRGYKRIFLIIGMLKDKDYRTMVKELTPLAERVILVKPPITRGLDPKTLAPYVKKYYVIINDPKKALDYTKKLAKKDDLILVTGSIYVVGSVYSYCKVNNI
jgi:dihydrofolate synthase/folylpolyglutamate synthase